MTYKSCGIFSKNAEYNCLEYSGNLSHALLCENAPKYTTACYKNPTASMLGSGNILVSILILGLLLSAMALLGG